jgi:isoleucyl-tRNA synthetase
VYKFFVAYANINNIVIPTAVEGSPDKNREIPRQVRNDKNVNVLDKWILSRLDRLIADVTADLDQYDTVSSIAKLNDFVQELSTWYLRRSRDRDDYYETLHHVLVTFSQLLAPIAPFISEEIYKNLTGKESVHLTDWPKPRESRFDEDLEKQMAFVRRIAELGHAKRKEKGVAVKQPLAHLLVTTSDSSPKVWEDLHGVIKDELNVKAVEFKKGKQESADLDFNITEELKQEGEVRVLVRKIQEERKKLGTALDEKVVVHLPAWPEKFEADIKKRALVKSLEKGEFSVTREN